MTNPSVPAHALVRCMPRNTHGRDLLVGDVHGHATKLLAALAEVGFDAAAGDRVFILGDLVDRGPESAEALALLERPGFFAVRGNHEDMLAGWVDGAVDAGHYRANGGAWAMDLPRAEALRLAAIGRALPVAIELETPAGLVGLVHAGCPMANWTDFVAVLQGQSDDSHMGVMHCVSMALWSRARIDHMDDSLVDGVRAVVVGHTPVERPTSLGNTHFIDCGAWWGNPPRRPFVILDAATLAPASAPSALQWGAA